MYEAGVSGFGSAALAQAGFEWVDSLPPLYERRSQQNRHSRRQSAQDSRVSLSGERKSSHSNSKAASPRGA